MFKIIIHWIVLIAYTSMTLTQSAWGTHTNDDLTSIDFPYVPFQGVADTQRDEEEDVWYDSSSEMDVDNYQAIALARAYGSENQNLSINDVGLFDEEAASYSDAMKPNLKKLQWEYKTEEHWYTKELYGLSVIRFLGLLFTLPTEVMVTFLWAYKIFGTFFDPRYIMFPIYDGLVTSQQFTEMFETIFNMVSSSIRSSENNKYKVRTNLGKTLIHFCLPGFFREDFEPKFSSSFRGAIIKTLLRPVVLLSSSAVAVIPVYMALQAIHHLEEIQPTHKKFHLVYLACLPFLFLRGYYLTSNTANEFVSEILNYFSQGKTSEIKNFRKLLVANTNAEIASVSLKIIQMPNRLAETMPSLESLFARLASRSYKLSSSIREDDTVIKNTLFCMACTFVYPCVLIGSVASFFVGQSAGEKIVQYFDMGENSPASLTIKYSLGIFVAGLKAFLAQKVGVIGLDIARLAPIKECINSRAVGDFGLSALKSRFETHKKYLYYIVLFSPGIGALQSLPLFFLAKASLPHSKHGSSLDKFLIASVVFMTFGESLIQANRNFRSLYKMLISVLASPSIRRKWPSSIDYVGEKRDRMVRHLRAELNFLATCPDSLILELKRKADNLRVQLVNLSSEPPQSFAVLLNLILKHESTDKIRYAWSVMEHLDGPVFTCVLVSPIIGMLDGWGSTRRAAQENAARKAINFLKGSEFYPAIQEDAKDTYKQFIHKCSQHIKVDEIPLGNSLEYQLYEAIVKVPDRYVTAKAKGTNVINAFEEAAKSVYEQLIDLSPEFPKVNALNPKYRSILELWLAQGFITDLSWHHDIEKAYLPAPLPGRLQYIITAGPFPKWLIFEKSNAHIKKNSLKIKKLLREESDASAMLLAEFIAISSFGSSFTQSNTPQDKAIALENAYFMVFRTFLNEINDQHKADFM